MKRCTFILVALLTLASIGVQARRLLMMQTATPILKQFQMYDDFSIPLAAGAINGTTTTSNGATWSTITRTVTDTRSIIDIETPVSIWPIGDSKTDAYFWPNFINSATVRVWEYPSRFARTGWPIETAAAQIEAYVAALPVLPAPANVLLNLGANNVTGSSCVTEDCMKSNMWHIISTIHNKWPDTRFFLVPVWRGNPAYSTNCTNWGIWIDQIVASNSFCFVGPYERAFITNSAWSSDAVHPDTYAGAIEWGARWRTNLTANWNTNTLPLGAYFRYNTNNSLFSEQMLKHTTNVFNTGTSDGRVARWKARFTSGLGIGTAEQFRISDGGNDYGYSGNFYEGAATNNISRGWFKAPANQLIDLFYASFRGYHFGLIRTNGVTALTDVNFYSSGGNNWQWNLSVRNINIGLHSVMVPTETWLPSALCLDEFSNSLVSDGKFVANQYRDLNSVYWPNGTNVSWTQRSGTWTVSSATIIPSALDITNAIATVPGVTDAIVFGLCGTNAGLIARFTDTNNYIFTRHTGTGGDFELWKVVAGVQNKVANTTMTWVNGFSSHRISVVGSNVYCQFGASQAALANYVITDAALMTGTNVGVMSQSTLNGTKKFGAFAVWGHNPSTPFGTQ